MTRRYSRSKSTASDLNLAYLKISEYSWGFRHSCFEMSEVSRPSRWILMEVGILVS